jgi:signal transduction histidine kinase
VGAGGKAIDPGDPERTGIPRFGLVALAAAAFTALFVAIVASGVGSAHARLVFVDVASFLVPLAAASACAWRASHERTTLRLAWMLLAAGCASWAIGQAAWAAYVLVLDQPAAPSPGIADAGYLGLVPLAGAGLLAFLSGPSLRANRLRTLLDAAIVALSLLFISWASALRDVVGLTAGSGVTFGELVYLAYPTGDLLLATLAFVLLGRAGRGERRTLALLGLGALALAVADTAYVVQGLRGLFEDGTVVHTGWIAGFLLIGLAAVRPQRAAAVPTSRPTIAAAALPYWPFLMALGAAVVSQLEHGFLEPFLFWTILLVVSLVVVRQLVVLTENLTLTRQAETALGRLRESEQARNSLVQTVTHDLRNPLTPILLQLAILQRQLQDEADLRSLAIVKRNVEQVERLVADLADVGKLQDGRLILMAAPMDLAETLRETCATFAPGMAAHGVVLDLDAKEPLAVLGDAIRLRQVALNLLSNAAKFTPAGGSVRVRGRREGDRILVEVQDDGRGLSPDEQARLFHPFVQVHDVAEQKERGTGLGLYICKGIAERHGGQAGVRSDGLGRGSTFWFSIPAASPARPAGNA